jgi:hypothetical protein
MVPCTSDRPHVWHQVHPAQAATRQAMQWWRKQSSVLIIVFLHICRPAIVQADRGHQQQRPAQHTALGKSACTHPSAHSCCNQSTNLHIFRHVAVVLSTPITRTPSAVPTRPLHAAAAAYGSSKPASTCRAAPRSEHVPCTPLQFWLLSPPLSPLTPS